MAEEANSWVARVSELADGEAVALKGQELRERVAELKDRRDGG